MANGINKVILVGRLGKKPELKHTQGEGKAVTSFSLAINQGKKDDAPLWVSIVAWEKTAEAVASYLDKGSNVYVEGRLAMRKYTKDGVEKERWEVVAHQVLFLDAKGGKGDKREEPSDEDWT